MADDTAPNGQLVEVDLEEQKVELKFEDPISDSPDIAYYSATGDVKEKPQAIPSKKKKKDAEGQKAKSASIRELFMYATIWDWLMMFLGFISAVIMGCALPLAMVVFGSVLSVFIRLQVTQNVVNLFSMLLAFNSNMGSGSVTFIALNNSFPVQNCTLLQPIFDQYSSTPLMCLNATEFEMMSSELVSVSLPDPLLTFQNANCTLLEPFFRSFGNLAPLVSGNSTPPASGNLTAPVCKTCPCPVEINTPGNTTTQCITNDGLIGEINMLILYFGIIAICVFIFGSIQVLTYQVSAERQVYKMRLSYYRAVLRQNIAWFDENASGVIASRLADDLDKVQAGIGDKLAVFFQWIVTFFAGIAVGFALDWRLTLVILGMTPFLAAAAVAMAKVTAALTSKEQKQYASAGAVAEEVLSSIRTVIAYGAEHKEADRYDSHLVGARSTGLRKGFGVGISLGSVFIIMFTSYAVAFWFSGWLISECYICDNQRGNILTVFFALLIGAFSLGQAGPNLEAFTSALGAAGNIIATIKRTPPIDSASEEGIVPETKTASIELRNVNHTYPARPDVQVLKDVSLSVEVGKVVALVGHSGCGKSTVIQLLQRFYDATSGEVLIGGHSVSSLNLKYLRSIIGVVSQEPVLFNMSIADNIRFGRDGGEGVTMEEVQQAAKAANVHDFIAGLPNGYDTFVGDRGAQLSGGQKQRVAIARALIREPKILLLDEATSALDSESEALVQAALEKAQLGRTTLVIAHRLSTIQNADCIVCMDKGEVVEMGDHAELMKMQGLYYDMVTAQSQGGMEEAFVALEPAEPASPVKSPTPSATSPGSPFRRTFSKQFSKQYSRQTSGTGDVTSSIPQKHKTDKQKQEEWDKELKSVSMFRLIALNAKEWWLIILGLIGAAVNGSIFPLFAILFGNILGVFAKCPNEIIDAIHLPAGLFLVIGAVSGIAIFLKLVCFSVSGEYLTARIRSRVFRAILRQEMSWFDDERNTTGALTTRLAEDAAHVQGATGSRLGTLLETTFGLLLALGIAFGYSWLMTFVILGFVPFLALATIARFATIHSHILRSKKAMLEAGKLSLDSIENIRTVTSLNLQTKFDQLYKIEARKPHKTSLIHGVIEGFSYGFSQSVIFLGYIIAFRFGAVLIALPTNHILHADFDDIFVVLFALIFGAMAVGQASAFAPDYSKAKLSANRIFAMLDREPVIDNYSEDGLKPDTVDGSISLNNITFSYPARPDVRVLTDISLSVKPGQTLALVGPSGCGKSTIVSLIERFYDPGLGNTSVDGNDLVALNIRWLRSQIGIVSQEPILFDLSIADNIRYGANHRSVSDEEVIEAARAANIHSFIQTLPEGYNTNVGEKGTQLSGGQKQRIAIARALIRNPHVLLLDEATSALDTESERIVQEALDRAREGRTSIVIAHRLSTIYNADCIAVITHGKLVEMGTHTELLAKGGLYYKLNQKQLLSGGASN